MRMRLTRGAGMNNRIIAFGAILLSGAIVALGWFLGVAPLLSDAAAADAERAERAVDQRRASRHSSCSCARSSRRSTSCGRVIRRAARIHPGRGRLLGLRGRAERARRQAPGVIVSRLSVGDASWYASGAPEVPASETPAAPPAGSASADGATPVAEAPEAPTPRPPPIQIPIDSTRRERLELRGHPGDDRAHGRPRPVADLMGALQKAKRLFLVTGFNFGGAAAPGSTDCSTCCSTPLCPG